MYRLGWGNRFTALGLGALALLWRLPHLRVTPGWDGDEGYNLDIAWHLLHGQAQSFALDYAFVQHPVLFYALVAPLLGLFGRDLVVPRAVAAVAGGLSAGILYLAVALSGNRRAGVLAALCLGGASFAVAYNRLGYTYNLLLLWTALTLLATTWWETTHRPAPLAVAVGAAALGLLTDQSGIALPLFVAARAWPAASGTGPPAAPGGAQLPPAGSTSASWPPGRRRSVLALAGGLLPAAVAAGGFLAWHPAAALADWGHTLARLTGDTAGLSEASAAAPSGPAVALARWALNYFQLLRAEWWWPAALAGLFCVRPLVARRRLLLLGGLLAVPAFAVRDLETAFRTAIPLLLPGAWGLGALLDTGMVAAYETVAPAATGRSGGPPGGRRLRGATLVALVVLLPLGLEIGRTAGGLRTGFSLPFDWALVAGPDQDAARQAAAHVNDRTGPDDVVVASPQVAWLYRARVADFLQAAASGGEAVAFYPAGLAPSRFRFDPSTGGGPTPSQPAGKGATFAVVDGYWDRWAAASGPVARVLAEVEAWPREWQQADVRVHRRPVAPG